MMYGSWDIRHNKQSFLSFWVIVCPLIFLKNWKIKILKKWKKAPKDIINLHLHMTNDVHMVYGSWDIDRDRQNLSFWTIFCPLNPLTTQKIKILKKWKKMQEDIILHMCSINENYVMYVSWDTECDIHIFFSFWTIFCPFTPLTTQKIKILEKWKKAPYILSFYTCVS